MRPTATTGRSTREPGSPRFTGRGNECGEETLDLADLQGPRAPADVGERRYRWMGPRGRRLSPSGSLDGRHGRAGDMAQSVVRYGGGQRGETSGRAVEPHPRNLPLDSTLRRNRPEGHYRHPHIVGTSCEILDQVLCGKPGPEPRIRSSWVTAVSGSRTRGFRGAKTRKGLDTSSDLPSLKRESTVRLMAVEVRIVRAVETALGRSLEAARVEPMPGGYSWDTYLVSTASGPEAVVRVAPRGGTLDPYDVEVERRALRAARRAMPPEVYCKLSAVCRL